MDASIPPKTTGVSGHNSFRIRVYTILGYSGLKSHKCWGVLVQFVWDYL